MRKYQSLFTVADLSYRLCVSYWAHPAEHLRLPMQFVTINCGIRPFSAPASDRGTDCMDNRESRPAHLGLRTFDTPRVCVVSSGSTRLLRLPAKPVSFTTDTVARVSVPMPPREYHGPASRARTLPLRPRQPIFLPPSGNPVPRFRTSGTVRACHSPLPLKPLHIEDEIGEQSTIHGHLQ